MQGFRKYLNEATAMAKAGVLSTAGNPDLRIVMGNTSCDMDSVVGALTLGYYYTRKSTEGHLFVPVINCNENDFFCNLEIAMHLEDCKIPKTDLFFWDAFRTIYKPEQVAEVVLVDHNILDVSQADLGTKVTRIIDHHVDANAYTDQLVEK